jgi:hypothetical protein
LKIKKLFALTAAVIMVTAFAVSVSAATPADIIAKLQADGVSSSYVAKANDYFKSNPNISAASLDQVSTNIDSVEKIMKANNVTDPTLLPASAKASVQTLVAQSATDIGAAATFSNGQITVTNSSTGAVYTFSDNDVKVTGNNDLPLMLMMGAGILLVLSGAAYVMLHSRRKIVLEA